jgi:hypothetical protein
VRRAPRSLNATVPSSSLVFGLTRRDRCRPCPPTTSCHQTVLVDRAKSHHDQGRTATTSTQSGCSISPAETHSVDRTVPARRSAPANVWCRHPATRVLERLADRGCVDMWAILAALGGCRGQGDGDDLIGSARRCHCSVLLFVVRLRDGSTQLSNRRALRTSACRTHGRRVDDIGCDTPSAC